LNACLPPKNHFLDELNRGELPQLARKYATDRRDISLIGIHSGFGFTEKSALIGHVFEQQGLGTCLAQRSPGLTWKKSAAFS